MSEMDLPSLVANYLRLSCVFFAHRLTGFGAMIHALEGQELTEHRGCTVSEDPAAGIATIIDRSGLIIGKVQPINKADGLFAASIIGAAPQQFDVCKDSWAPLDRGLLDSTRPPERAPAAPAG